MQDPIDPFAEFLVSALALWADVVGFLAGFMVSGPKQNQVFIVAVLIFAAWCLHRWTGTLLQNWVRSC